MNFIRNQNFRAGSKASLEGLVCPPQRQNQSKSRVFSQSGGVKLGSYVTLSYGCTILTSGLDTKDYPHHCNCKNRKHVVASVIVGDGVWLCANVTIVPGVKIAKGVIVASGSVVTKDLEKEGWLYGGVPAEPIKPLYYK